ncbi:hypothetical protein P154DRAFT_521619 [Amniculicola lignicola CBS 123094]|uniref:Uncharacterized protein n=1 Tax=Amniculicola lignicola CBS 123094 TaxID=1392246 RepID=A0A6A5WI41_9PLEO|nr:hypothetical protein P154DRAFT_521619 [Amniculicola lignicola CBS 123094]
MPGEIIFPREREISGLAGRGIDALALVTTGLASIAMIFILSLFDPTINSQRSVDLYY